MQVSRHANILPLFNPYTLGALGAIALGIVLMSFRLASDHTGMTWLYLLMLVQIVPFAVAVTRKHFNYLSFVLFNHFVTYSVARYNRLVAITKTTKLFPETILAIQELIACTLILSISYITCRALFFYDFPERQRYQLLSMSRFQLLSISLYVISIPFSIDWAPPQFLILHFAMTSADMLLLYCVTSPGNEPLARVMKVLVPLSCFVYFIRTGFLTFVGQFAGFWFITTCLRRRYRDFIWIALFTVIISAIQSVKEDYRSYLFAKGGADADISTNTGVLWQLLYAKYVDDVPTDESEEGGDEHDSGQLLKGFDRIGDDSLERVLAMTPSRVPFWNGETYASIPYMFIPRFLWPGKPSRHFWNKFGRAYGVLSEDDYSTSVGVCFFAEAYMNFGFGGMYALAVVLGGFLALCERLSYWYLGGYYYFTFIVFLTPLLNFSSDLGSMVNSMVVLTGVLYAARNIFVRMARRDDYSE